MHTQHQFVLQFNMARPFGTHKTSTKLTRLNIVRLLGLSGTDPNTSTVTPMIEALDVHTLVKFYIIVHNLVAIYSTNLLIPPDTTTRLSHYNTYASKYIIIQGANDTCKNHYLVLVAASII